MTFAEVVEALQAGKQLRRTEAWEDITVMYADGDELFCKRGDGQPYSYPLSWFEIVAADWRVAS